MKKLITILLVMTFLVAVFTGCGDSGAVDNDSSVVENEVSETDSVVTTVPVTDEASETVTTTVTEKSDTKPIANKNAGNFKEDQKHLKYIGDEITGFIEIPDDFAEVFNYVENDAMGSMLTRQQGCTSDMGMIAGFFAYDASLGLTKERVAGDTKAASESNSGIISTEYNENISFGPYNAHVIRSEFAEGMILYSWVFETDDGIVVIANCNVTDTYREFAEKIPSLYTKNRTPLFDGLEDENLIDADSLSANQSDIQDPFKDSGELEVRISPNDSSKARVGTAEYGYVDIPAEWLYYEDDSNKYYISESEKLFFRTTLFHKEDYIDNMDSVIDSFADALISSFIEEYPDGETKVEKAVYCDSKYTGKRISCKSGDSDDYIGVEYHFFGDEKGVLHMIKFEIYDVSEESNIDPIVKSFSFE